MPKTSKIYPALAVLILSIAPQVAASSTTDSDFIYPAIRHSGKLYVISTDWRRRITKCRPIDGDISITSESDCTEITKQGVPKEVKPGRSLNSSEWLHGDDLKTVRSGEYSIELLLEVGLDGRVTGCVPYHRSTVPALDDMACKVVVSRASFKPATMNGKPTHAVGTFRLHIIVPG